MENFYVIYGINKGLIKEETKKIINSLKDADIIKYDMANTLIEDVIEDASTVNLFNKKKIIILENCYFLGANKTIDNLEKLEQYIEHYNSDSYLIFICNAEKLDSRKKINKLLSHHKVIEANKVDKAFLIKHINSKLKEDGYEMNDINFFLERVGTNLNNIDNELDKLKMYRLETKKITNEDITKTTTKVLEEEIFSLTDSIILKDTKKALELLDSFLNQNYDEIQIILLLANQFHFLFQVKRLINKNKSESEIAKILEVNPYRVKYSVKKIYSYSEDMILENIKKLAKIDHDIKLGKMDKNLALKLFILH